jgi:hypothetical protein
MYKHHRFLMNFHIDFTQTFRFPKYFLPLIMRTLNVTVSSAVGIRELRRFSGRGSAELVRLCEGSATPGILRNADLFYTEVCHKQGQPDWRCNVLTLKRAIFAVHKIKL